MWKILGLEKHTDKEKLCNNQVNNQRLMKHLNALEFRKVCSVTTEKGRNINEGLTIVLDYDLVSFLFYLGCIQAIVREKNEK